MYYCDIFLCTQLRIVIKVSTLLNTNSISHSTRLLIIVLLSIILFKVSQITYQIIPNSIIPN